MPPFRDRVLRSHGSPRPDRSRHAFLAPAGVRDPIVGSIGCLAALAALLVLAGERAGALELVVTAVAVVAAVATDVMAPRLLALATMTAYLAIEAVAGGLGYDRYWWHVLALALVAGAVLAAGHERAQRTERRGVTEVALERADEGQTREKLGALLQSERRLDDLDRELVRSRRHVHDASVLLVRPDGIDDVRSRFGDAGAAEVLRVAAQTIGESVRGTDVGASERDVFNVLLPETPSWGARVAAERIRLAVSAQRLVLGSSEPVDLTVSIGAASFPADAAERDELLARATAALERARALGGNRTVLHSVRGDAPPRWGLERTIVSASEEPHRPSS